jgi:hypothetical protein
MPFVSFVGFAIFVLTPSARDTRINYEEGRRRQPIPRKKPFVSFVGFATFVLTA